VISAGGLASAPDAADVIDALERRIRGYAGRAVVAFSGGVDSSVVLAVAARALTPGAVTAVTAVSPSLAAGELEASALLARDLGVEHRTVRTNEVEREAYARNDEMRCFHCKAEMYATLGRLLVAAGGDRAAVLAGANADDTSDIRPGLRAGALAGIRNPLLEEGVRKPTVRAVARALGLSVAEKPALACLSSRVEIGLRITPTLLSRIDVAERAVRALGFDVVRVRHRGERATIEVDAEEVERLLAHPELPATLAALRAQGWGEVSVDPLGYRQGGANAEAPAAASPKA
jgi:pyridinium-3,5-biscarboxylic acid mononucleotide sulfurtransferase